MCGIAGTYSPDRPLAGAAVGTMLDVMAHRGPDDRGTEVLAGGALVLGHLRLSILDLSPLGHQPMASADRTAWIVYNGEVYNFREVRSELTGLGWRFRSDSDTEVILAAYRQWGLEAIGRFRGMFAFALWDGMRRQLHLCRDRFGVKPLYYSVRDGVLAFASESKALNCAGRTSRSVDPTSVAEFVQYGYISAPRSVFADVSTVRPGTVCTFDEHLQRQERVYWQARDLFDGEEATRLRAEVAALADEPLLDRVEASLKQAFAYRMVADVPVGLFLSGGIDSSLVATLLARRSGIHLNTFTIGYGASEFDETAYARQVAAALGATHVELEVSPQAALDIAMEIPEIADEPIGDSSLVPTLMVSRLARQHVKVALSADGADELFGGYARYAYCGDFAQRQTGLVKALYRLSGEVLDRVEASLQQAFEYRMVADVPVGLFLSGGIDSSLVATLLARRSGIHLNTFTIGYGASEFDETVYARQVAATLGATHVELEVSPQAALDIAMEIPEIADEPIGDSSLVPTLMVSRLARQHVKVALSADGADELFGGYARYAYCGDFARRQTGLVKALYRLSGEVLDRLPPRLIARAYAVARSGGPKFAAIDDKLRKFVRMSRARDAFEAYDAATSEWPERESLQLLKSPPPAAIGARAMFESVLGADVRDRFMHQDVMRYLPGDLLVKVDRASMFVSLEAREPFLDHEAARLAAALPISWKIRDGQNKYVLRRLLARYFPPQLFDRPKQGFSAPVGQWLRGPLREPFLEALSPARVRAAGLLDEHVVSAAVDSFLSSAGRHGSPAAAWILFQLQQWADRWLRAPEPQHASVRAVAL